MGGGASKEQETDVKNSGNLQLPVPAENPHLTYPAIFGAFTGVKQESYTGPPDQMVPSMTVGEVRSLMLNTVPGTNANIDMLRAAAIDKLIRDEVGDDNNSGTIIEYGKFAVSWGTHGQKKANIECACGQVKISLTGEPLFSVYCHCTQCRRTTAAPFFNAIGFPKPRVVIDGDIKGYMIGKKMERCFCTNCGSYMLGIDHEKYAVPGAAFTQNSAPDIALNIYCSTIITPNRIVPIPRPSFAGGLTVPVPVNLPVEVSAQAISSAEQLEAKATSEAESALALRQISIKCACEQVKIVVKAGTQPLYSTYCHCTQCQRTMMGPMCHVVAFPKNTLSVEGTVKGHAINKTKRSFCTNCGTFMIGEGVDEDVIPGAMIPSEHCPAAQHHRFTSTCMIPGGPPKDGLPRFENNIEL